MRHAPAARRSPWRVPALAACTENAPSDEAGGDRRDARALTVSSTDDACDVSATEAPAGTLTFDVTNAGSQVTEFYLLGEDGLRIVGEVENVGPQLTRELVVNAPAGDVPHRLQAGHGRRRHPRRLHRHRRPARTPSGQRRRPGARRRRRRPTTPRTSRTSPTSCWPRPQQFVDALQGRRRRRRPARSTPTRAPTGSGSRPVAESFGDLDPKIDAREADLEPGQKWTGWHRIEKDLWPRAGRRATRR